MLEHSLAMHRTRRAIVGDHRPGKSMTKRYDAAVIGTGGIGSAALFHLSQRGLKAIGIDQFPAAHAYGSSHGQSRIIRQAYFEHPDYVPLLFRAYELWAEIEAISQRRLFEHTGLVEIGPPDGALIRGIEASAQQHALNIEKLTPNHARQRFPTLRFPDDNVAIFEPTAGMLYVEDCVLAHLRAAQTLGADLVSETRVVEIETDREPIRIVTEGETVEAERAIICGGAWASQLIPIPRNLRVVRKHLHWFFTERSDWQAGSGCPAFFYDLPEGYFYGFPKVDARGVKVAEHSGGETVVDPGQLSKEPAEHDNHRVEAFVRQHLEDVDLHRTHHDVCMYTLTDDEHFIVDHHPENPNIAFAAGMSGHGFKFAPVLGEALCELVTLGHSKLPIGFLAIDRD